MTGALARAVDILCTSWLCVYEQMRLTDTLPQEWKKHMNINRDDLLLRWFGVFFLDRHQLTPLHRCFTWPPPAHSCLCTFTHHVDRLFWKFYLWKLRHLFTLSHTLFIWLSRQFINRVILSFTHLEETETPLQEHCANQQSCASTDEEPMYIIRVSCSITLYKLKRVVRWHLLWSWGKTSSRPNLGPPEAVCHLGTFEKDAASNPHAFGPLFRWLTAPETGEVFQNRAHEFRVRLIKFVLAKRATNKYLLSQAMLRPVWIR